MKQVYNGWARVLAGLKELEDTTVEVGWFEEDAARVAYINDRGGSRGDNPPPRPVLGPGMDAAREEVDGIMAATVSRVLRGGGASAVRAGAERAGEAAEQGVRDVISAIQPPNAPSTIAGKHGYSAPLRGFSPDRIWNKLEHRVTSGAAVASDGDGGDDG